MTTYECSICYGVNHVSRFSCQDCGTVRKEYSGLGKEARRFSVDCGDVINSLVPVVVALGVDRTERHRTCKRVLRTVPADYYAGVE